ncbi:MAG: hypothetical protein JKY61_06760, partial [Planctomycetes bacterium]|nr:hypothetical protein [Planctomycetota bacterium]
QISRNFYGSSGNGARNNFYDDSNDPIEETAEPIEDDAEDEKVYRDDR